MKQFKSISQKDAKLINGGSIMAGIEAVAICVGLFYAGWECGRGMAKEVKSWF